MQFFRGIIFISLILGLQCCTSPKMSQELQMGRISFQAGDFKQAFHELLPVAVSGNAEAQYAVGYMYYYGYGAARDKDSGLFWMNKAAAQHYGPALKALQLIHSAPEPQDKKVERDEVLNTLEHHRHPVYGASPKKTASASPYTKLMKGPAKKIPAAEKGEYTLQLMGAYDVTQVKKLQHDLKLQKSMHVWRTEHNGKDWYVLTYGRYASLMEAKLMRDKLPAEMKKLGSWVRKMDGLVEVR